MCEPSKLLNREQYYLDLLMPEYNILKIASSRLGHKLSKKTKEKIRDALKGRKHTDETIKKLKEINKIIRPETYLKLSLRTKGVKVKVFDALLYGIFHINFQVL